MFIKKLLYAYLELDIGECCRIAEFVDNTAVSLCYKDDSMAVVRLSAPTPPP